MGRAGRPNVPDRIKRLTGTIRMDRTREGIEFTVLTEIPKPEVWLDAKAKKYFRNMARLLIDKKLLTDANIPLVLMMAQEFSTYEKAVREIKKEGEVLLTGKNNYLVPSPWIAIRNQAQKNYRDIAALFGLDPVSSQKIGPIGRGEEDPFETMQKKYNQ